MIASNKSSYKLRGEFEYLKMEDKEQVTEYITQVEKVANQLGRDEE